MSDLLFWRPADGSAELVFGDTGAPIEQHVEATLAVQFSEVEFSAVQIPTAHIDATFDLGDLVFEGEAEYKSRTQRPTVAKAQADWQVAALTEHDVEATHSVTQPIRPGADSAWGEAAPLAQDATAEHADAVRLSASSASCQQSAQRLPAASRRSAHQDADRTRRRAVGAGFEQAVPHVAIGRRARHQDADRRPRAARRVHHQNAARRPSWFGANYEAALPGALWHSGLHQEAKRPDAGIHTPPVVPPTPGGYVPTGHLLFAKLRDGTAHLVFNDDGTTITPEGTVIVPVRSVYMILNNIVLRRVSDNAYLLPISMSLKLDVDSWTWGFSASLPASAQALVEPSDYATPVELEAVINGHAYRVLVESINRERTFGTTTLSIGGRGKSAYLDAPYAPVQNFANTEARTAQQLMADVLTFNGASIGWTVDFGLTDWLVPSGAWSHQGSYISALKRIAEAGGGYIQPDPTLQRIFVKPTYPIAPWDWASAVPNFELPADVTTREGIEWLDAADYNGVYVSGESVGVLALVKRTGTLGDNLAEMIVDPLATHVDMTRQRGLAVLGYTGRIANVTLKLPVLAETGVIRPGAMVRYVDGGATRIGLVRSTQVDFAYPEVFQSIGVETHA